MLHGYSRASSALVLAGTLRSGSFTKNKRRKEKAVDRLPLHDGFARLPLSILITTFDSLAVSMRSTDLRASVVGSLSPGNNAVVLCWWSRAYYGSISLGSNDLNHTFTEGLIQIFRRESPTISVHMGVSQGIVHTYSFGSPSSARLSGTSSSLHSLEHRLWAFFHTYVLKVMIS